MLHLTFKINKNKQMKALILGATGATGKELVKALLLDDQFQEVHAFARKDLKINNAKLKNHIVDFDQPEIWANLVEGDVAFSCMGTTLKAAGSKEAQKKVDYNYQLNFAEAAKKNGIEDFILVSAYGANANSKIFYNRIKGELEEVVKKLNFPKLTIFQPGMLERSESERPGEVLGLKILRFVNKIGFFKSQKPLPTNILAKAMVNASKIKSNGLSTIKLASIFSFADKHT
jgi:uncharacterized protein YbjT (DUF2867 family)